MEGIAAGHPEGMPFPDAGTTPGTREGGVGLDIVCERAGETVVLTLHGELDMQTVPQLRAELADALTASSGAVVVDLTDVVFIDSTGLAALLNALRRLTRARRRMLLVAGEGPVRRMLQLTRLDSTFALHDSPEAAVAVA
jgi:anti-sigma B factor antagonist